MPRTLYRRIEKGLRGCASDPWRYLGGEFEELEVCREEAEVKPDMATPEFQACLAKYLAVSPRQYSLGYYVMSKKRDLISSSTDYYVTMSSEDTSAPSI